MEAAKNRRSCLTKTGKNDIDYCPQCGVFLVKKESLIENEALYIRYYCSDNRCEGTLLKKIKIN